MSDSKPPAPPSASPAQHVATKLRNMSDAVRQQAVRTGDNKQLHKDADGLERAAHLIDTADAAVKTIKRMKGGMMDFFGQLIDSAQNNSGKR